MLIGVNRHISTITKTGSSSGGDLTSPGFIALLVGVSRCFVWDF